MALEHNIEHLVIRQDQVGIRRHPKFGNINTARSQHVHLAQKHKRVDHHTVTDDGGEMRVQHATGNELKRE